MDLWETLLPYQVINNQPAPLCTHILTKEIIINSAVFRKTLVQCNYLVGFCFSTVLKFALMFVGSWTVPVMAAQQCFSYLSLTVPTCIPKCLRRTTSKWFHVIGPSLIIFGVSSGLYAPFASVYFIIIKPILFKITIKMFQFQFKFHVVVIRLCSWTRDLIRV